ncbi:MAG TPA: NAD+ synthase [Dissulfurispiraceae bacterium]|nr:NAD+ synthase [Dissulfurispiraceae bacterium]
MKQVRLALCQMNPTVGDLAGNTKKIVSFLKEASAYRPDFIVFPELAVTGYPPEDLVLKPQFVEDNIVALDHIRRKAGDSIVIVGFVDRGDGLYNAAAVLHRQRIVDIYHKIYLPNFGVFDEYRYFRRGSRCTVYEAGHVVFGINICEDIWNSDGPAAYQASAGAHIIININASPYHMHKHRTRFEMLAERARDNRVAIAYLNMIGGQDELVFDGHSLVLNAEGQFITAGKRFEEELIVLDVPVRTNRSHPGVRRPRGKAKLLVERVLINCSVPLAEKKRRAVPGRVCGDMPMSPAEEVYHALVLGTRDYVLKNGFADVCIGLSGGIDSAIVATIAVDAIGKEHVHGVFMPSPFTSKESREDVSKLVKNLGISLADVPITQIFKVYLKAFQKLFKGHQPDTTEENIQARIRGNILMAMSNKFGWLVLTTGNKSEMSVGYATLYGDMAGGFAVIKDVPKTLVYTISRWRNIDAGCDLIPERILTKEPTAELKPDQKDADSLPPYEILDPVLKAYIEEEKGFVDLVSSFCDADCVKRIVRMVDLSEYKRRQSPPGIKITLRAFGKDRRFPITNRYRSH